MNQWRIQDLLEGDGANTDCGDEKPLFGPKTV